MVTLTSVLRADEECDWRPTRFGDGDGDDLVTMRREQLLNVGVGVQMQMRLSRGATARARARARARTDGGRWHQPRLVSDVLTSVAGVVTIVAEMHSR